MRERWKGGRKEGKKGRNEGRREAGREGRNEGEREGREEGKLNLKGKEKITKLMKAHPKNASGGRRDSFEH